MAIGRRVVIAAVRDIEPDSRLVPHRTGSTSDVIPIQHETFEAVLRVVLTFLPLAALGFAGWLGWGGSLHWQDLVVLAVTYVLCGFGITIGFHRLLTHRSFKTTRPIRALFAVLGSMAIEGPVIAWVSTHRKHHRFSDEDGDPHSPHGHDETGLRGTLRGLGHAHIGWIFRGVDMANPERYSKDLLADPDIRFIDRTFPLWAALGLVFPFGLGMALTGTIAGGLTGFLWGGAVRLFLLHHVTYSINSLCHFFGRKQFPTGDESRNLAWLAPLSFGEAWHNNHHAFPTSARHGLGRFQVDPGAWLISALERFGLAWDVVRIPQERQRAKHAEMTGAGQKQRLVLQLETGPDGQRSGVSSRGPAPTHDRVNRRSAVRSKWLGICPTCGSAVSADVRGIRFRGGWYHVRCVLGTESESGFLA